jgi:hypothetical protein
VRSLLVLAVSSVLVAGCVSTTAGHGTRRAAEAAALPRDGVVVSIRDYPGFVSAVYAFRAVPSVVIAADGTAVRAVASRAGQDTAMPRFRSTQVGRDAVRRLLASAADLGLLGVELDFGSPAVSDLGATTVEFRLPRRTVDQTAVDAPPGTGLFLTPTERDRQQRLARFRTLAESLVGDDAAPYRSPTVAVRRTAAQTPRAATTVPWPLRPAALPKPGGCRLYIGTDAVRVQAAAEKAYVEASWASGPIHTSLYFRPVLPGSTGCD